MSMAHLGFLLRVVSGNVSERAFGGVKVTPAEQDSEQLVKRLALLRADYNQLKQDADELLRYADAEIAGLKRTNTGLAEEYDDLQLRVWELEQQVDELLLYIAQLANPEDVLFVEAVSSGQLAVDLSQLYLGLVGGHDATRRGVVDTLSADYGLKRWVEVPPHWDSNIRKRGLKDKLQQCDLIVIITGYMNHSLTQAVFALKNSGSLRGEVVLLNFRGRSGVVREILRLAMKEA